MGVSSCNGCTTGKRRFALESSTCFILQDGLALSLMAIAESSAKRLAGAAARILNPEGSQSALPPAPELLQCYGRILE